MGTPWDPQNDNDPAMTISAACYGQNLGHLPMAPSTVFRQTTEDVTTGVSMAMEVPEKSWMVFVRGNPILKWMI